MGWQGAGRNLAWWAAALCTACHAAPPPPPPPPPPPVVVAPPPPPPPKCEKIEEACVARPETRARIGLADWELTPPDGWTYAQGEEVTTAVAPNATLAVSRHGQINARNERAVREEVLRL